MTTKSGGVGPGSGAGKFLEAAKYADPSVQLLLMMEGLEMTEHPVPIYPYPAWVRKCAEKVNRSLFPRVFSSVKSIDSRRAYCRGLGIGMMIVAAKQVEATLPSVLLNATEEQKAAAWQFLLSGGSPNATQPADGGLTLDEMINEVAGFEAAFGPVDEVEFLQGKADAGRMLLGENESNESTRIYTVMLIYWRLVEVLPTTQSLFDFLTKSLGQNVVGSDPKRVQQLCRRIGKKFGKPGRPRKTTSA